MLALQLQSTRCLHAASCASWKLWACLCGTTPYWPELGQAKQSPYRTLRQSPQKKAYSNNYGHNHKVFLANTLAFSMLRLKGWVISGVGFLGQFTLLLPFFFCIKTRLPVEINQSTTTMISMTMHQRWQSLLSKWDQLSQDVSLPTEVGVQAPTATTDITTACFKQGESIRQPSERGGGEFLWKEP